MNYKMSGALAVAMLLTLTACGKKETVAVETAPAPVEQPAVDNNAFGTGYSVSDLEAMGIMGDPTNYRTVFFAYDSSEIAERSRVIIEAHSRVLGSQSGVEVTLEGHCDERGTREYNLALGERRAQGVARLMSAAGAGNNPTQNVSYGEERPVALEHNDSAWSQNRRVEILY